MTAVTNAQTITVLKHLAAGRQPEFAAQVTHLPQRVVEDIAEKHGWPDPEQVRKGIFELTRVEQAAPSTAPRPTHTAPPASTSAPRTDLTVARHAPAPALAAPERPRTATTSAAELLHMASESDFARTRTLGKKINGLLADLTQRLNDEEEGRLARIEAKREAEKKARRIAELKAELASLTGKTAQANPDLTPSGDEPTAKEIRAWAAENDVECPAVGRVPNTVREAYDNAHATDAA